MIYCLIKDIDDLDNDLFGKNLKKTGAKGTAKTAKLAQTNKKVSFAEKSKTPSSYIGYLECLLWSYQTANMTI